MQAPSPMTASRLQDLLRDGSLTGEWVLDPHRSHVRLKSKSMGLIAVNGVFGEVDGNGAVSPDGLATGTITVAAASIDTGNPRRDRHLRSADFFEVESYPDITFTADSIRPAGDGVAVTGALTVHGRCLPFSFEAGVSVPGDGEAWLDAEVRINRGDFGITWNWMGAVSMFCTVTVRAVFTRG